MKCTISNLILLLFVLSAKAQVGAEKPNIILIVSDDLNNYIQLLNSNPDIETPNITEIANNGILFTNAYVSCPLCGPSRTSFLTGKDLHYTQVYSNDKLKCFDFQSNFTPAKGNEEYYTLPGYLKNTGGYFTYSLNKIFHCPVNLVEYDEDTEDACEKTKAWNRYYYYEDEDFLAPIIADIDEGVDGYNFGKLNDTLEPYLDDYIAVDSAISFINQVAIDESVICNKPFFLALGINKPHKTQFLPEKYFLDAYIDDFSADPFNIPYNFPANAFPANGVIMPPQPEIPFSDLDSLPLGGLGREMVEAKDTSFVEWVLEDLSPYPVIDPDLTEEERIDILTWSKRANAVMAYLAAVNFVDAQVGRLFETLSAHPEILNNSIIIFMGDNGYSLGQKRHWEKYALWDTDVRTSLIIADFREPVNKVCTRTVGLLDLFPTICDLVEIEYPQFIDGSDYLDGESLLPLINNPLAIWERPVLSSEKQRDVEELHCFPQYSVRNERFHYIRYQSNGGGELICDEPSSYFEEELYEIGIDRKVDPYEWNNLINDEDYTPVLNYLRLFLPDSLLYLQKVYSAKIVTKTLPCLLNDHTSFKLQVNLYNDEGVLITGAALSNYQFKWTNNLTAAVFIGKTYSFNTATILPAEFAANDKIRFYLEVTDLLSGELVAFNTHEIFINGANKPVSSFNIVTDDVFNSADIVSYSITGSYTNTYWTFGDGITSEEFIPDTHFYTAPGPYTITNFIEYGNGCLKSKAKNITITRKGIVALNFSVFPNPVDDILNIVLDKPTTELSVKIIDVLGKEVFEQKYLSPQMSIQINTQKLIPGNYIIVVNSGEFTGNKLLEIVR